IGTEVRLYSDGIRQVLDTRPGYRVVGVASKSAELLLKVEQRLPDVVLLDPAMPGALEALRGIRRLHPAAKVVALGEPGSDELLLYWAEAGIAGFVGREASTDDLLLSVEGSMKGELHCSPKVAGQLLRRLASRAEPTNPPRLPLTGREAEIFRLVEMGLSNKEIAAQLGIEVGTVKNHVHNLLEKLRVRRRSEAIERLRGKDPRRPTPHPPRLPD
ncbi:MAG TPA: response regulator transcription factor, partial [Gemmatimonadales bacterium]|nr:response regulator transcription factor [Gemmatimonadales bacterium]